MDTQAEYNPPQHNENQEPEPEGPIDKLTFKMWQYVQIYVDRYAIYPKERWLVAGILFIIYIYRAYINQGIFKPGFTCYKGFHIISYFLGLYMLDKFLGFISPKDEEDVAGAAILPTRENEEFRPFRRAIKELDLWYFNKLIWGKGNHI